MLIRLGGSTPYLALNAVIADSRPLISVITLASWAVVRALPSAGKISAARRAMITITTISSTRVKPRGWGPGIGERGLASAKCEIRNLFVFINLAPDLAGLESSP